MRKSVRSLPLARATQSIGNEMSDRPRLTSIAGVEEHTALNQLYLRLGYHAGIADDDVVYVARVDGDPVGLVRRARVCDVVMLRGMHIAPAYQRQGVGSRLLRAFAADLPPADCYCIPFAHLTRFYAQVGFAAIDESDAPECLREHVARYRAEGHSVLLMRRDPEPRAGAERETI